jgi:hypothetical protein
MSEPTPEQILSALDQSGYLFEQKVADSFEQLGFHVETSWAFLDEDQEKSRELDAKAIKRVLHDEIAKFSIFIELLIECKAYENPMVFLQRPKNQRELEYPNPREYVFPIKSYKKQITENSYQEVQSFQHLSLRDNHYYYHENLKATQFSKIVRKGKEWGANHDGIYDSILLPLSKALDCERAEALKLNTGEGWKYIWLIFPVVVLRDGLLTLDISKTERKLESKGRVSFVRHIESGNAKGFYLTDFITYAHIGDYVEKEIKPFYERTIELYKQKPSEFLVKKS